MSAMLNVITGLIRSLNKKLDYYERKITDIVDELNSTQEVSNLYYSSKIKELNKLYDEMKAVFKTYVTPELEKVYNQNIRDQISRIKNIQIKLNQKTETAIKNLKTKSFLNSDYTARSFRSILNDTISSFVEGVEQGKKTFLRFINKTQQLVIEEKKINEQIVKGIIEGGSVNSASKKVKDLLSKKLKDGKYITIIDKNGNPRDYNVKSYSEMVARTKLINAQAQGTIDIARKIGQDLVQVSDHNTECEICGEIEGRVFSLSGNDPDFEQLDFEFPLHPNCKHTLTVIFREIIEKYGVEQYA